MICLNGANLIAFLTFILCSHVCYKYVRSLVADLCMYCAYAVSFCVAAPGYSGETCDSPADACASSPCYNDGTCSSSSPDMFECACPFGEPALKVVVVVVAAAAVAVVAVVTKRQRDRGGGGDR